MGMGNGVGRAALRGSLAGALGVLAMDAYFRRLERMRPAEPETHDEEEEVDEVEGPLDDISLIGRRARQGERSTEAVGRIAYRALKGEDPPKSVRGRLGTAVHWGYGVTVGGLYGLLQPDRDRGATVGAGLGYGVALWALGDELAVPLLGLAKGPTAVPPRTHADALGAHLVYGLATAAAARALGRVL